MSALLIWLSDWQQGAKNLATWLKMEKFLNTHPISTPARFQMNWMKTFSVNSPWPSDARWRQRSGSTLAQVMLPSPEPMLTDHQWSPVHIRAISEQMPQPSIIKICLKITCLKLYSNFPGANELIPENLKFDPIFSQAGCQKWKNF